MCAGRKGIAQSERKVVVIGHMLQAQQVLDAHWDAVLPVQPSRIARRMGLQVQNEPAMDESARIELQADGVVVITVSVPENGKGYRFAVAHEIGHYVLGHVTRENSLWIDSRSNFTTGATELAEMQANSFAASLLMPERVVRFAIGEGRRPGLADLASLFGVSEVAMHWRLKALGLLSRTR